MNISIGSSRTDITSPEIPGMILHLVERDGLCYLAKTYVGERVGDMIRQPKLRNEFTTADYESLVKQERSQHDEWPEIRQRGRILPTEKGVTAAAVKELAEQHQTAFQEAVLDMSSFVRASHDMDGPAFFKELHRMVDVWEQSEKKDQPGGIFNAAGNID